VPRLYHLADKADFRLDPKKAPQRNTTMGGEMKPGIFLSADPETWMNGYGYWRPFLVEFEVPSGLANTGGGYGGEMYVLAEDYDKIRINRVITIDAYARERFGDWGWTEEEFGTLHETGEPLPPTEKGQWFSRPPAGSYRAPDVRSRPKAWLDEYKKRVTKFRRKRGKGIMVDSAKTAMNYWMGHRPTEGGPPASDLIDQTVEAPMPEDMYEHPEWYCGYPQYLLETMRSLRAVRGKPNAQVTIYRAQPKGALNTGDWVSLSKAYAEQDLASEPGDGRGGTRSVETYKVPAHTVRYAGDDLMEWGYWGPTLRGRTAKVAALPSGLFYRTHDKARPFAVDDATSQSMTVSFDDHADKVRKGYSALANPWDLWVYLIAFGWMKPHYIDNDDVIAFSGKPRREKGTDGEPLVVPDMRSVTRYSWPEFERLLLDTPRPAKPGGPGARHGYFDNWGAVANRSWEAAKFSKVAQMLVDESLVSIGMEPQFSKTSSSLSLENVISVAEETMVRGRDNGQMWNVPSPRTFPEKSWDPGYVEATRLLREFVQKVLRENGVDGDHVRVYQSTYGLDGAVASTDGMNSIQFRDNRVDTLTVLHECAHFITRSNEGEGHDRKFIAIAADLYGRYISPGAKEQFLRVVSMIDLPGVKIGSAEHDDSVMIALRPSEVTRKVFAEMDECTESIEDLHLTLAFLGTKDENGGEWGKERIYRALYDFAINAGYRGLTAKVNGVGYFTNPDSTALITLWDIPGIAEFRTHIITRLKDHGHEVRNHGFTPHMTLGYVDEPPSTLPEIPEQIASEDQIFVSIWLVWGEEWTEVTFL
jgi:2'-5' RNA ligase